ncbi:MAG: AMP-binding protein [Myxococcales bacterium]|nr:AMP-binding protein [Myxococcales bacterium]
MARLSETRSWSLLADALGARYDADFNMAEQVENLVGRIFALAKAGDWEDRVALREGAKALRYLELAKEVAKSAAALRTLGVSAGDRVAIYSPDCIDAAVAILGAVYVGAIALPVSELSAANELRNRLNNAKATVVLAHADLRATADEISAELSSLIHLVTLGEGHGGDGQGDTGFSAMIATASDAAPKEIVGGESPALLLYSAGASNESSEAGLRGVLHSHHTPVRAFQSFGEAFLSLVNTDKVFSTVRLSTAYGLGTGLLFPLLAGAETLLMPEQAHSTQVFEVIKSFTPTVFSATPSLYGQLARDASKSGNTKILSGLRWCIAGAEGMPPKVIAMVRGVLGSNVAVGYGLTEAFQFVIAGEAEGQRPGNCGKVLDGIELRIVDNEGKIVGEDEIGTLQLRGANIIQSYWGSGATLTEDGWFTTLDRFMVDAAKNYYHCGRSDHLFKVGGKWVAPAEVEQALLANESVWECAVIGADDEDGLIKPFAFIVPNIGQEPGDALEAELREYVKNELAPYKYPRWIEFVDALPKGPSGVILRYKLRDRLKQSRDRRVAETRLDRDS